MLIACLTLNLLFCCMHADVLSDREEKRQVNEYVQSWLDQVWLEWTRRDADTTDEGAPPPSDEPPDHSGVQQAGDEPEIQAPGTGSPGAL
jgi:hypothetical protein